MRRGSYTGSRDQSVIDYVIGNDSVKEEVERLVVEDKVDSDHHPLEVWIREDKEEVRYRRRDRRKEKGGGE